MRSRAKGHARDRYIRERTSEPGGAAAANCSTAPRHASKWSSVTLPLSRRRETARRRGARRGPRQQQHALSPAQPPPGRAARAGDTRLPWHRARRLPLPDTVLQRKRAAVRCFASQLQADPSTGRPAIVSSHALQRLLHAWEIYFI